MLQARQPKLGKRKFGLMHSHVTATTQTAANLIERRIFYPKLSRHVLFVSLFSLDRRRSVQFTVSGLFNKEFRDIYYKEYKVQFVKRFKWTSF